MSLRVVVTATDVAEGVARDCAECPVARAMARAGRAAGIPLPAGADPAWYAWATAGGAFGLGPHTGLLPARAVAFIGAVDRGATVAPIQFDLPVPDGQPRPPVDPRTRPRRPDGRFRAPG